MTTRERGSSRILLAEDDREMRALVERALRAAGYDVTACRDGSELLLEMESDGSPGFDLIVSDVRMPGMTGIEILEDLSGDGAGPPIILITAFGDPELHARARRLGAAAVLDKPFELRSLLARVREILDHTPH